MSLKYWVGIIGLIGSLFVALVARHIRLEIAAREAAAVISVQQAELAAANNAVKNQQEVEHAIQKARKEREALLEQGACLTGDEHIDYLLRVLGDDAQNRCSTPAGSAAH